MSNENDANAPKEKVQIDTFCVRFRGDEKTRLMAYCKSNGIKALNDFVRTAALEKANLQPSV